MMFPVQRSPFQDILTSDFPSPGALFESVFQGRPKAQNYHVEDTDEASIIHLVLPGVVKEDIDIEAQEHTIRIAITRDEKYNNLGLPNSEKYRATLDHDFNVEDVSTTFENGILEIRVPKASTIEETKKIIVA